MTVRKWRRQDWVQLASVGAFAASAATAVKRRGRVALGLLATAVGADALGRVWSRRDPGPFPASMRWLLRVPHADRALRRALEPLPGERILELGPGLGQHAVAVAEAVGPDGQVDVVDLQQEMLDETMLRASGRGLFNLVPTLGDANEPLPFPDDTFDAAYLMTVLGEIPDQNRVLTDLARVLRPGGRLVVGEMVGDPDFVRLSRLRRMAEAAGFEFEERVGSMASYCARFRVLT